MTIACVGVGIEGLAARDVIDEEPAPLNNGAGSSSFVRALDPSTERMVSCVSDQRHIVAASALDPL